jgi:tRNA A37 threonylcarbamoyladenosine synthetase subunit TsaC/SUA5/YrdC
LIQRFSGKARPDTTTYNILISLSKDRDEAATVFDELLHAGLSPNTYTLNGFLPFCQTLDEAREALRRMGHFHIRPNTQTFNALIAKATSTDQARQILQEMQQRHLDMNAITLSSLIVAADHFQDALEFYRAYLSSGIKPTINTLVTLLKKASSQKEIDRVEKERTTQQLPANLAWNRLLKNKTSALE